jgi:NTE family protein
MKALVLAGGSILGAFQVGAIAQVLKSYQPDIIYGVSVGALNRGYLANFIGKNFPNAPNTSINWIAAGDDLKNFWLTNLAKPEQLVRQRSTVELIYQFAMKRCGECFAPEMRPCQSRRYERSGYFVPRAECPSGTARKELGQYD